MRPIQKLVLVGVLFFVGLIDIFIYLNVHLYYRAEDSNDLETKIQILERANRVYPWNDRVFYELGKAYFTSSIEGLIEGLDCVSLIQNSSESFNRSLQLNPANPFCHFYYAQSLLYENLLIPASENRIFKEFKSAAQLAGENRELCFEAGKRLFARWKDLTNKDRVFVLEILKKTLERMPVQKFSQLMRAWEMNIRDVGILEKFMPEDPQVHRLCGAFLGEKSFPLSDRHKMLSKADFLQLKEAERLLESGKREYNSSRLDEAEKLFVFCLGSLYKIRFFHKLSGQYTFADSQFQYLFKSVNYYLARCIIESDGRLGEILEYIHGYLDLEEDDNKLREFESYLAQHEFFSISIQVHLFYKLGRYQDLVNIGDRLHEGTFDMPDLNNEYLRRIFIFIGEAYQRKGQLLEAATFYERSIQIDPSDLLTLMKALQVYSDLSQEENILEVDKKIRKAERSKVRIFPDRIISHDSEFSQSFYFDGANVMMELNFQAVLVDKSTLITVELNREVVWDNYLEEDIVSIEIKPVPGKNTIQIKANTFPFALKKLVFK